MKIIASLLVMIFMLWAAVRAQAQSPNPCDDPNHLPAYFFDIPPGPQGDWTAIHLLDLKQTEDQLVPVVVASVSAIQGPPNRRGMRLGCSTLKNRSEKAVVALRLRWILVRLQDRSLIAEKGYTSDTVLAQGQTPVIEFTIPREGQGRTDFSIISFSAVTKDLVKDGILKGDYSLIVGVSQIRFEDGSVWEAKPLLD